MAPWFELVRVRAAQGLELRLLLARECVLDTNHQRELSPLHSTLQVQHMIHLSQRGGLIDRRRTELCMSHWTSSIWFWVFWIAAVIAAR